MAERVTLIQHDGIALTVDPDAITAASISADFVELEPDENGWVRRERTGKGVVTLQLDDITSARWEG